MNKNSGRAWHSGVLYVFFLCLFIDLGGELYFRYISLAILFFVLIQKLILQPGTFVRYFLDPIILCLFVIWPIISCLIGLSHGADQNLAIQNILALSTFPLLLAFFSGFDTYIVVRSFTLAAATLAIFVIFFWLLLYINNPIALASAQYLTDSEAGYFGIRGLSGVEFPVVYFKATLFFVPAVVFSISQSRLSFSLILLGALMAATSKTGAIVAGLLLFVSIGRRRPFLMLFLLLLGLALLFYKSLDDEFRSIIFALFTDEYTLNIRLDHWNSLLELFSHNPLYLLFGQGAGTLFYSSAVGGLVNNIELDHLNSIRKFGLIWFIGFFIFVSNIGYRNYRNNRIILAIALLVSFVVCGTNPVLFTLLFFSILAFSHIETKKLNRSKKQNTTQAIII